MTCVHCGKQLPARSGRGRPRRFCGPECKAEHAGKLFGWPREAHCRNCGKAFARKREQGKYCRPKCRQEYHRKTKTQVKHRGFCALCGQAILSTNSGAVYCSRECFGASRRFRSGEEHAEYTRTGMVRCKDCGEMTHKSKMEKNAAKFDGIDVMCRRCKSKRNKAHTAALTEEQKAARLARTRKRQFDRALLAETTGEVLKCKRCGAVEPDPMGYFSWMGKMCKACAVADNEARRAKRGPEARREENRRYAQSEKGRARSRRREAKLKALRPPRSPKEPKPPKFKRPRHRRFITTHFARCYGCHEIKPWWEFFPSSLEGGTAFCRTCDSVRSRILREQAHPSYVKKKAGLRGDVSDEYLEARGALLLARRVSRNVARGERTMKKALEPCKATTPRNRYRK